MIKNIKKKTSISFIVADHLRTIVFALSNGVIFSSKGRGYVLKKMLKNVCNLLYSDWKNILTKEKIKKIVEKIIFVNSFFYKELILGKSFIVETIIKEVEKQKHLTQKNEDKLLKILEKKNDKNFVESLFFLYDTEGVSIEIIKSVFKKKKIIFPKKEFNLQLKKQIERSKKERNEKKITVF